MKQTAACSAGVRSAARAALYIPPSLKPSRSSRTASSRKQARCFSLDNPLSVVCSIVCNHISQCEGHCIRGRKDIPVHFSSIENFVSETYLERDLSLIADMKAPDTGKRSAIIGSDPAGMAAAIWLSLAGCDVTMFEQKPAIGGVLEYGIPEFRLPKRSVEAMRELLLSLGVKMRTATTIGGALKIDDLLRDGLTPSSSAPAPGGPIRSASRARRVAMSISVSTIS